MLSPMLALLIVLTALLLAGIGVRAERHGRSSEIWACNVVAVALFAMTVSAHASGRIG